MHGKGKFFLSPENNFDDKAEDLKSFTYQTKSPITTETDIDVTAVLLPSGGIQSHHHAIKTAISETEPPEVPSYESCFHNGHSIIHPEMDVCVTHHYHLFQYPNLQPHCSERKNLAMSTLPFSFGNNSKSGFLQHKHTELIDCHRLQLEEFSTQTQMEKKTKINVPSLLFQHDEEPFKDSMVKKLEDKESLASVDLDSSSQLSLDGTIVAVMCSENEQTEVCFSEVYSDHNILDVRECCDSHNMRNVDTINHQEEVCTDTSIDESLTLEKRGCDSGATRILDPNKQSLSGVITVKANVQCLQESTEVPPLRDPMQNPYNGLIGKEIGRESSTRAFKTGQGERSVDETTIDEEGKHPGIVRLSEHTKQETRLENSYFVETLASVSLQGCENTDLLPVPQLKQLWASNDLHKHNAGQTVVNKPKVTEIMPGLTTEVGLYTNLELETREPRVEPMNQPHDWDQERRSNDANFVGSLEDAISLSGHRSDSLSFIPTNQIDSETVTHNNKIDAAVPNKGFQDRDISSETANKKGLGGELSLNQSDSEQASFIWFKDTDPRSRPRNTDLLRIAISPASLDHEGATSLTTEPLSHPMHEGNVLDELASDILLKTSVEDVYGSLIKECGHSFLEELRRTFLEAGGCHFTLLDSGLALSRCEENSVVRSTFVTMWNGTQLGMTVPRSSLFPYYRLGIHFYVTENLNEDWFRVKDRITQESMLMKKVPVISNWKKLLHNFMFLPPHPLMLVPCAVLYDRNGSILYLMEDRQVLAVGHPPDGYSSNKRKLLSEVLTYLRYCKWNSFYPGDIATTMIYTTQGICFDPSGLLNNEDHCVFKKTVKRTLRLLLFEDQQDHPAMEFLVDTACQWLEEDLGWIDPMWQAASFSHALSGIIANHCSDLMNDTVQS